MVEARDERETAATGAPKGARGMALVRWVLVGLMAVAAAGSILYHFHQLSRAGAAKAVTRYYCPMHPAIVQDQPGDCPICGMTLVPTTGGPGPGHAETAGTSVGPGAGPSSSTHADHSVPGLLPLDLPEGRIQLIGMRTARVTREALSSEIRTVGFVTASEKGLAVITPRFSGWIERLLVNQTGERVSRGQVLATVYSRDLLAAQQEFLNARRWSGAGEKQSAAARELSATLSGDSRSRLELLGISRRDIDAIARTGQPLQALPIRSPVAGYVTQKGAIAGLYVQPGTSLFEIADLSRVWVLAEVYEHELGRVRVGQHARFELSSYPGRSYRGTVGFIYPAVDPSTRTLRLRLELKNPGLALKPGMYGKVAIELERTTGLVVSGEAVVDTGDVQYVFVALSGGKFEPRRVGLGTRSGTKVQVLSGLEEGETVVTTGNFLIDSESRLRSSIEGIQSEPHEEKSTGSATPGHAGHGAH